MHNNNIIYNIHGKDDRISSTAGNLSFSPADDIIGHGGSLVGDSAPTSISASSSSLPSSAFSRNSGTVSIPHNKHVPFSG